MPARSATRATVNRQRSGSSPASQSPSRWCGPSGSRRTVGPSSGCGVRSIASGGPPSKGGLSPRACEPSMVSCNGVMPAPPRVSRLKLEPPQQQILEHDEVAREAVEGVSKGGGSIALEHEMPHPREAVAEDRHGQKPSPTAATQGAGHGQKHQGGAHEMEPPRDGITMLGEVV